MELKKGKVYKIRNNNIKGRYGWKREYIICSPQDDVIIDDWCTDFKTYFIMGFDEKICFDERTTFDADVCTYVEITPKDYDDIKRVIDVYNTKHNTKMLYNRKKNCLVFK